MATAGNWNSLRQLIGLWTGVGSGEFPTIEHFTYREEFTVVEAIPGESLRYVQQTWRTSAGPDEMSHVETGFINLTPFGDAEILNAQGSDRLERLAGRIKTSTVGFTVSFLSTSISHDDRMITSWREWQLADDEFSYSMGMSTVAVPDGAHHLSAELHRHAP